LEGERGHLIFSLRSEASMMDGVCVLYNLTLQVTAVSPRRFHDETQSMFLSKCLLAVSVTTIRAFASTLKDPLGQWGSWT
jgi:hypothetical protein